MRLLLAVDLPSGLDLLSKLRRTIRDALSLCCVTTEDIDDVELMIGELSTNAARHSSAGDFRVEIDLKEQQVTVVVADTGAGFKRDASAAQGTLRTDGDGQERIGGWGLPLVESLADELTFMPTDPHGTMVRVVKTLRFV